MSVVSLIQSSEGDINGNQSEKFGLLMKRTSSLYLNLKLNDLASLIFLFLQVSEDTPIHMKIRRGLLEVPHSSFI